MQLNGTDAVVLVYYWATSRSERENHFWPSNRQLGSVKVFRRETVASWMVDDSGYLSSLQKKG